VDSDTESVSGSRRAKITIKMLDVFLRLKASPVAWKSFMEA